MTPIINEICDEVVTADGIETVLNYNDFLDWIEYTRDRIRTEGLRFEFPNFSLYSTPNGAFYYWPYISGYLEIES